MLVILFYSVAALANQKTERSVKEPKDALTQMLDLPGGGVAVVDGGFNVKRKTSHRPLLLLDLHNLCNI